MKKIIFIITVFFGIQSFSQKIAKEQLGMWNTLVVSKKINDKFSFTGVGIYGTYEPFNQYEYFMFRAIPKYKINKTFSASIGYAYFNFDTSYNSEGKNINQHRLTEDFNIDHKISNLRVNHRFRIEQVFMKDIDIKHLLRYHIELGFPIHNKFSGYLFNEIRLNANEDVSYSQNWASAGIAYRASKSTILKLGYLNQDFSKVNYNRIQLTLVFLM